MLTSFINKPRIVNNINQNIDSNTTSPSPPSGKDVLLNTLEFSKYSIVDKNLLPLTQNGFYRYTFTYGNDQTDTHNNFEIEFPQTWELFIYTNDKASEEHGTNLILRKGVDFLRIKQQLYETGTCSFEKLGEFPGMAYQCELVEQLDVQLYDWKVFTVSDTRVEVDYSPAWKVYGICDQDAYARNISSHRTPDQSEKKACSPWTPVGEIGFFSISNNQQNYDEFKKIIMSIQIIE